MTTRWQYNIISCIISFSGITAIKNMSYEYRVKYLQGKYLRRWDGTKGLFVVRIPTRHHSNKKYVARISCEILARQVFETVGRHNVPIRRSNPSSAPQQKNKSTTNIVWLTCFFGGDGGIRTHGRFYPPNDFESFSL